MDSNPYAFNRDVSYPTCAGFPRNMTCKDLLEAHIQVVVPGKASGRGDFTADVEDIFSKYRLPHISSETVVGLWQTNPMGFWQNQVNFAVWCSTTGCGVSWRDHLDIDRPLARSVFRFHTHYQVRRILDELQVPLPQDQAWDPFQNPYDRRAYERLCREFGVDPSTDWRQKDSNSGGLGTVYQYNHGYQPKGSWNRNRMRFQPDSSLSANSSLWSREHIDYIAQGPEADEAWSSFILDKSQGFTAPGVERLNDSIRTYVWAILGAQAQTRSAILGAGTSFDAQKQFLANVEDAISSPVDIPSVLRHRKITANKSDTLWNINLNVPARSMSGILMLFEEPAAAFQRDTEAFCNPKIEKVEVCIEGIPNQLYSQGMRAYQLWGEARKHFAAGTKRHPEVAAVAKDLALADVSLGQFLTSKHALWLDLRTTDDDQLHGSGRRVENASEGVTIQISKKAEAAGTLNIYLYVIMDAQLNIENGRFISAIY